jgi:hypothetical protein
MRVAVAPKVGAVAVTRVISSGKVLAPKALADREG